MDAHLSNTEPLSLRWSNRALQRLRRAYSNKFGKTIQAYRMHLHTLYSRYGVLGVIWAWMSIFWELQVRLPKTGTYQSLTHMLLQALQCTLLRLTKTVLEKWQRTNSIKFRRRLQLFARGKIFLVSLPVLYVLLTSYTRIPSEQANQRNKDATATVNLATPTSTVISSEPSAVNDQQVRGTSVSSVGTPGAVSVEGQRSGLAGNGNTEATGASSLGDGTTMSVSSSTSSSTTSGLAAPQQGLSDNNPSTQMTDTTTSASSTNAPISTLSTVATATPESVATATATVTPIPPATATATVTPVPPATATATITSEPTATVTPEPTATATATITSEPTATVTPVPPATATATITPVPTATVTPCVPEQPRTVDVMLVIDRSSSMEGDEIRDAKAAAITFLHLMDLTTSQVGLVTFAKIASLDSPLTHNAAVVEAALDNPKIESGSYIDRGINIAADELTGANRNPLAEPIMIILSDGRATDEPKTRVAAEQAKARGIRVLTIGIGHHMNEVLLRDVASAPEDFYASPSSTDLMGIYTQIAAAIVTCQAPINNSSSSSLAPFEKSTPVPSPPIDATATVVNP